MPKNWRDHVVIQKSFIYTSVRNVSTLYATYLYPSNWVYTTMPTRHQVAARTHSPSSRSSWERCARAWSCACKLRSSVQDRHDARIRMARTLVRWQRYHTSYYPAGAAFREAEAFKLFRLFVRFWVVMRLCRIDTDCSSLRNTGAIWDCVILPGNSYHDDCFR